MFVVHKQCPLKPYSCLRQFEGMIKTMISKQCIFAYFINSVIIFSSFRFCSFVVKSTLISSKLAQIIVHDRL